MTSVVSHQFTCMLCGQSFSDEVLARDKKIDEQDSDFRVRVSGLQPLSYMIHSCPQCGFMDYSHQSALSDDLKKKIKEQLDRSRQGSGPLTLLAKYELLAEIARMRELSPVDIAEAYLNASWAADDDKDAEKSAGLRQKALECFIQALEAGSVSPMEAPVITYLAGELCRRLGRFDDALGWFEKVSTRDAQLERLLAQQVEMARGRNADVCRIPA